MMALQSSINASRIFRLWLWAPILLPLLVVVFLFWLHFSHRQALEQVSLQLDGLKQAQIDLNKGFLQISLAKEQESPFSRRAGQSLIAQSMRSIERAIGYFPAFSATDVESFKRSAAVFSGKLQSWGASEPFDARFLVEMRIAFTDLEQQTQLLEVTGQKRIRQLSAENDRLFVFYLLGSALVLATLLTLLLRAVSRRQRALHKQALSLEARLRSENRFRHLFENAPVAMALVNDEGVFLAHNRHFETLFGYNSTDVGCLDDWWPLAYPEPEYRRSVQASWASAIANAKQDDGNLVAGEYRVTCKDGSVRTVQIAGIFIEDGLLRTFTDVSAQRQAERQLTLWVQAFRQTNMGLIIANANDNTIISVNPAFALERGYEPDELIGMLQTQLFPIECQTDMQRMIAELDTNDHGVFESEHLSRDGRRFPILVDITLLRESNGQAQYLFAYVMDLTERKHTEQALADSRKQALQQELASRMAILNQMQDANAAREKAEISLAALANSEAKMRVLINSIPDLIWLKDVNGVYLLCNSAFERLYAVSEDKLIGHSDYDFCNPELATFFRTNDRRALDAGHTMINEEWLTFADNGYRGLFQTLKTPMTDAQEQVVGVLGVARDITSLRQAQDELLAINASLESRVAARTAELETLNQSLESFVYSVSHDLKAPLRGIQGYSQLLQEDYDQLLDEDGRQFIIQIRNGVARMGELIDDLLAYSRMERRALEDKPVELHALLAELLSERGDEINTRGVLVVNTLSTVRVRGDKQGLQLVLRNLLENAFKFSAHADQPRIEINSNFENAHLIVSIADNGIGFDMTYHDRIFEIFQRLHRMEDYPGTGIGLALVKKAMLRMKGEVWAKSTPGNGATFFLKLPIALEADDYS